jgi:Cu(I)/Ag(I) efflux system membrane fusion protein
MPLEPAASLDPIHSRADVILPLVIPATAPLITGKRAIVYLELPDQDRPTFEGRTVTLGPRAGEDYLVLDGLKEGDRVVTHGNFKIDSELQIRGRPSMMSPPDEIDRSAPPQPSPIPPAADQTLAPIEDVPPTFGQAMAELISDYLKLVDRLAADDLEQAREAATAMAEGVRAIDASGLPTNTAQAWQPVVAEMIEALEPMGAADAIGTLRQQLVPLTRQMETAVAGFGAGQTKTLFKVHCPMAFNNRGADWLQDGEEIANPYLGSKMFRCGEITGKIP